MSPYIGGIATAESKPAPTRKSVAGNIRILKQLRTIIDRTARRGLSAAKETGDRFSEDEINALREFKISAPSPAKDVGGLSDQQLLKGF